MVKFEGSLIIGWFCSRSSVATTIAELTIFGRNEFGSFRNKYSIVVEMLKIDVGLCVLSVFLGD